MGIFDSLPVNRLQTLVSKSCTDATTVSEVTLPNSMKQQDQANRFIDLLVDESALLQATNMNRVSNCSGKVHMLDFCGVVTEGACTTACPTPSTPQEFTRGWSVEKYRAFIKIDKDFLECNIEGASARDTILGMFSKAIRMDMEYAGIMGDSSLTTGEGQSRVNNLLGVNDGWRKILFDCVPECQVIDAEGHAPSKYLYWEMKRRLPNRYKSRAQDYRWIVPPSAMEYHALQLTSRETPLGDSTLCAGQTSCGPWGTPFFMVPLMPEDIPTEGDPAVDGFDIWYTPLSNLKTYILRDITIERERNIYEDKDLYVVHYRADFEIGDPDAVVLAKNVAICGTPFTDVSCQGPCDVC